MKEAKLKEDLFGRLLGKEGVLEPLLVGTGFLTEILLLLVALKKRPTRSTQPYIKPCTMFAKEE